MASDAEIQRAFDSIDYLLAMERKQGDRRGQRFLRQARASVQQYKAWERSPQHEERYQEAQLTEATYQLADGRHVLYDDGPGGKQLLEDATDLYTVLKQDYVTGSPNLENRQAKGLVQVLQSGQALSEMQIGLLRKLVARYAPAIARLRRSRDKDGQDWVDVPSASSDQRILTADDPTVAIHARR